MATMFPGSRKKKFILGAMLAVAGILTITLFIGGMVPEVT